MYNVTSKWPIKFQCRSRGTYHVHSKHVKKILGGKSNGSGQSVWELQKTYIYYFLGYDFRGCNFLLFLVCSADLDIHCCRSFFHHVIFYSFMFMHKISTQVVCIKLMVSIPQVSTYTVLVWAICCFTILNSPFCFPCIYYDILRELIKGSYIRLSNHVCNFPDL